MAADRYGNKHLFAFCSRRRYDYNADPHETMNLATVANYSDIVTKLDSALRNQYNPAQ